MIPAAFAYHRPASVPEAVALLQRYNGDAKLLSGGHSLLPILKLGLNEPAALIDLSQVAALRGVRLEGAELIIGAFTRHYDIATSALTQTHAPLLAEAAAVIGDPQVRNRGTIGGSLTHGYSGSDLPAAVLALGGTLHAVGPNGARTIAITDLFEDIMSTKLSPNEVLTELRVPVLTVGQGSAYEKFPQPASRFAVAGVAALVTLQDDRIITAAVGLTGASTIPLRLAAVEAALTAQPVSAIPAASTLAAEGWDANEDIHGSAEYRRHLATVMTRRALDRAVANARGERQERFGLT